MKKQSKKRVMTEDEKYRAHRMMTETAHGLGINRSVPRVEVERLERHINAAARISVELGMGFERFTNLCDNALDEVDPKVRARWRKLLDESPQNEGARQQASSDGDPEEHEHGLGIHCSVPCTKVEEELGITETCDGCNQPIGEEDIRIFVPEVCDKDVDMCGYYHRDCGIEMELGENPRTFEENVIRLFAIFKSVLTDWCDPDMVRDQMLPQIKAATETLNQEVLGQLDFVQAATADNGRAERERIARTICEGHDWSAIWAVLENIGYVDGYGGNEYRTKTENLFHQERLVLRDGKLWLKDSN
jgi:hypothetical protein